ncbi:MAG: hypothetical protein Q9196_000649 [Gyalolechia fulgens]
MAVDGKVLVKTVELLRIWKSAWALMLCSLSATCRESNPTNVNAVGDFNELSSVLAVFPGAAFIGDSGSAPKPSSPVAFLTLMVAGVDNPITGAFVSSFFGRRLSPSLGAEIFRPAEVLDVASTPLECFGGGEVASLIVSIDLTALPNELFAWSASREPGRDSFAPATLKRFRDATAGD